MTDAMQDQGKAEQQAAQQPPYLLKARGFVERAHSITIEYARVMRDITKPGDMFRHVENTGRVNKSKLHIFHGSMGTVVPATRDDVKQVLRRMRPEEWADLQQLDKEFVALEAKRKALQDERSDLLQRAWGKAHVVTVKELTEQIEHKEA